MNYEPIGIDRFAKFDPDRNFAPHVPGTNWIAAMIYCLKHGDMLAARFIKFRNRKARKTIEHLEPAIEMKRRDAA